MKAVLELLDKMQLERENTEYKQPLFGNVTNSRGKRKLNGFVL